MTYVATVSKYYDTNNFNKLTINKNSTLVILHLNIASLSKLFDDLHDLIGLLNRSFDIIGISEHKISNNTNNINFSLQGYTFCYNECESSQGEQGFFLSLTI